MTLFILLLLAGILLLFGGGELLIRGAVSAAERMGVSPLFSGLVIAGFGTSSPELVVSLQAALQGSADIAVGNVVGSNMTNVLLIIGLSAMVSPLKVVIKTVKRDGTVMIGAVILFLFLAADGSIGFVDGCIMVACLIGYLVYTYRDERLKEAGRGLSGTPHSSTKSLFLILVQIISGLILLIVGSDLLVKGAIGIAQQMNLSEALIGLTIVALGTSTPELAVSVMAAWKGNNNIAIGSILGSNIYNILGILGITSLISSLTLAPRLIIFDQWALLAVILLFVLFMATHNRVTRAEGFILFAIYVAYILSSLWFG